MILTNCILVALLTPGINNGPRTVTTGSMPSVKMRIEGNKTHQIYNCKQNIIKTRPSGLRYF